MKNLRLSYVVLAFLFSSTAFAGNGATVYASTCKVCHGSGIAGAPKVGDKSAWKDRIAGGLDYLVKSAINGKQGYSGVMPPRGGNLKLSDQDVRDAVNYMVDQVK